MALTVSRSPLPPLLRLPVRRPTPNGGEIYVVGPVVKVEVLLGVPSVPRIDITLGMDMEAAGGCASQSSRSASSRMLLALSTWKGQLAETMYAARYVRLILRTSISRIIEVVKSLSHEYCMHYVLYTYVSIPSHLRRHSM